MKVFEGFVNERSPYSLNLHVLPFKYMAYIFIEVWVTVLLEFSHNPLLELYRFIHTSIWIQEYSMCIFVYF
jgi:hypothetical protein